ncbi:MAG: site-2 protease family protein [Sandaracinaceae bacterium]
MGETTAAIQFRFLGFPVRVTPFFFLMSVVLGWPASSQFDRAFFIQLGMWVAIVGVSILWHELGHGFAMRRYGYTPSITLHWMGGFTRWGKNPRRPTAMERVWVSLAGPFAGFMLGLPCLFWWTQTSGGGLLAQALEWMVWVNLGFGALNLIPMLPWDGGLAVHGLLDRITKGRGRLPTAVITIVMAVLSAAAAFQYFDRPMWPLVLCWFSVSAGIREIRAHRAAKTLTGDDWLRHGRKIMAMPPDALMNAVLGDQPMPRLAEAADRMQDEGLPLAASPAQRAELAETLAWTRLMAGQPEEARWAGDCMGEGFAPSVALATLLALTSGDVDAAAHELASGELEMDDRGLIRAFVAAAQGRLDDAHEALEDDDRDLGARLDVLLFLNGHFEAAAQVAEALFEAHGQPTDAYNAACSHARAGRPEDGLAWLKRAVEAGFDDVEQLVVDDDLETVCALPGGRALIGRLRAQSTVREQP